MIWILYVQNYTKKHKLPSIFDFLTAVPRCQRARCDGCNYCTSHCYFHFGKKLSGSARPLSSIMVVHAVLRRLYYSAQRCASHSLRLTKPFSTLPPALFQRRNSACTCSVGAPWRIFLRRVLLLKLPRPRL